MVRRLAQQKAVEICADRSVSISRPPRGHYPHHACPGVALWLHNDMIWKRVFVIGEWWNVVSMVCRIGNDLHNGFLEVDFHSSSYTCSFCKQGFTAQHVTLKLHIVVGCGNFLPPPFCGDGNIPVSVRGLTRVTLITHCSQQTSCSAFEANHHFAVRRSKN